MQHRTKKSPKAAKFPPRNSLIRWCTFGMLCAMVGGACFVDRFPLLPV
ncbi:hypothetical protein [Massilia consociata]|uniref:Uncharacterized protein n=1 Tax=Massilia consociata TaxID=760117 RepID=A0ABV6FBB6_9BURK